VPGRVDDPPAGGHDPDDRVGRPHRVRRTVNAGELQQATDREERQCDDQQDRLAEAAQPGGDGVHSDRSRTIVATLMRFNPRHVLHCASSDAARTAMTTSTTVEVCMRSSHR